MNTSWKEIDKDETLFEGRDRKTNKINGKELVQILFLAQTLS